MPVTIECMVVHFLFGARNSVVTSVPSTLTLLDDTATSCTFLHIIRLTTSSCWTNVRYSDYVRLRMSQRGVLNESSTDLVECCSENPVGAGCSFAPLICFCNHLYLINHLYLQYLVDQVQQQKSVWWYTRSVWCVLHDNQVSWPLGRSTHTSTPNSVQSTQ